MEKNFEMAASQLQIIIYSLSTNKSHMSTAKNIIITTTY